MKPHIGRKRARTAQRLEAALRAEGFDAVVDPSSLRPAQGYWRTDYRADVQRWEGSFKIKNPPEWGNPYRTIMVSSWDTMTDCARGLTIDWESGWHVNVYADKSTPHPIHAKIAARRAAP